MLQFPSDSFVSKENLGPLTRFDRGEKFCLTILWKGKEKTVFSISVNIYVNISEYLYHGS